jgi:hypothetical protein
MFKLISLSFLKDLSQKPSTGEIRMQSTLLKTKVNAVHAGLSQLLLLQKVFMQSRLKNSLIFLNNNLLIVYALAVVAMEESYHTLSNIYKKASKFLDQTIPT